MPTMTLAHAHGAELYYETHGESGRWLVLLNGMSQSTASWMTHTRHLRESMRVLTYDARGQYRSPLAGTRPALDDHVADLVALLDAIGVDRVVACGFSHGARIALRLAATYPDRVQGLALTSTGDDNDAMRRTIVRRWVEVLDRGGLEAMAWCSLTDILGREYLEANEAYVEAMVRATLQRNHTDALRELLVAMRQFPDPLADAARVRCPSLLMTSATDLLVSEASALRLAASLPDVRHAVIGPSGHTVPIEQPDVWRAELRAFVARVG